MLASCSRIGLVALALSWAAAAKPSCSLVDFEVPAQAGNLALPLSLNISNLSPQDYQALATLPLEPVNGTYHIAARYCEPEKHVAARHQSIQILVHGVTYTKDYWSGLGPPGNTFPGPEYSYVDYASKQGYPTLAIDRICNGDSAHPNGLLSCQLPLNAAILANLISRVRTTSVVGGRQFQTVLPICHSEGSTICQFLMQTQPDTPVGTWVLTAYSNKLLFGAPGSYVAGLFLPAAVAKPTQYATLLLDPTYQIATSESGARGFFYAGDFDPAVAHFDLSNARPLTLGELATAPLSQLPALQYSGSVFVINGARDQIFCAVLPTDPLVGMRGDCGEGESSVTAGTKALFPNAKYQWAQIENTGHDLNLHRTAAKTFKAVHDFLASEGF